MAISREDILAVDLSGGSVSRSFQNKAVGEGDFAANVYGIRAYRNGQEVDLSGATCIGYFIRPDDITLVLAGTVEGNKAAVELPEAAYARTGSFTLAIKVNNNGMAATMRIIDGTVVNTTTGEISDSSAAIPNLQEIEAKIAEAEALAANLYSIISVAAYQVSGTRYGIAVTKST